MSHSQILPLFGRGEGHPSWLPADEGENYWDWDKKQVPDVPRNIRSWKTGPPCVLLPQLPHHSAPLPHVVASWGTDGEQEGRTSTHPLVVHVGQDPCHQLNKEDHQQQAEILG